MRRVASTIVPLLVIAAFTAEAQAPVVTPGGDPSVKDDTIYSLIVNPKDYADQRQVLLLDDGIERFETDGSGTRTYRQVVQVLTPEAVRNWGEISFRYSKDREKLTVNWVRVLDSTGKVISSTPVHEQESLAPVALSAPVYSDQMIHRVSLGGVAPGTIVDYSYTVTTIKALIPGDYFTTWSVQTGSQTQRSRFIVDLPASVKPHIIERHLTFARRDSETHGRRVYVWATKDIKKPLPGEPFAPDSSYGQNLTIGATLAWADVGRWYAGLAKGRYELDPEIEAKVQEVIAGAKSRDDTLSMIYRWVAQDFRYVSLSLGIGGYQPHPPAMVFTNKYGDCKDKATFFIAIVRRLGYQAYPVLLSASGGVDTTLASARQFNHMIAAVATTAGGWQFLDLTAEVVPYGAIPTPEQGQFGLLVRDDGASTGVIFPELPLTVNQVRSDLIGELNLDGGFRGKYVVTGEGNMQYPMRYAMSATTKLDSAERVRRTQGFANSIIAGSSGDSMELFNGRDLKAVPRYSIVLRGGKLLTEAGSSVVLELPLRNMGSPETLRTLEGYGPRKMPIDAGKISGSIVLVQQLRLTLPAGWRARLPADIQAVSRFGTYEATYAQVGRELRITRKTIGAEGVFPTTTYGELMAWVKEVSRDDVKVVLIDK